MRSARRAVPVVASTIGAVKFVTGGGIDLLDLEQSAVSGKLDFKGAYLDGHELVLEPAVPGRGGRLLATLLRRPRPPWYGRAHDEAATPREP